MASLKRRKEEQADVTDLCYSLISGSDYTAAPYGSGSKALGTTDGKGMFFSVPNFIWIHTV
jgi:hypothetical protein